MMISNPDNTDDIVISLKNGLKTHLTNRLVLVTLQT